LSICAGLYYSHAKQIKEDLDECKIAGKSHFANWQPQNSTPKRQIKGKQQQNDQGKFSQLFLQLINTKN